METFVVDFMVIFPWGGGLDLQKCPIFDTRVIGVNKSENVAAPVLRNVLQRTLNGGICCCAHADTVKLNEIALEVEQESRHRRNR